MNQLRIGLRPGRCQIGVNTSMESAFRFIRWADSKRGELTWKEVAEYLGCHRATAYRWLNAYNASRGPK